MEMIKTIGDSVLRGRSMIVEKIDQEILTIIDTLESARKKALGVGISAPQIGINKRIIIVGFTDNSRYPDQEPIPIQVMINPEYKSLSEEIEAGEEGCLSVPGKRGIVNRFVKIRYRFLNEHGNKVTAIAEDFKARIIQHEVDHLNGVLFIDKTL